ncbi:SMI1/KNR4 family protein [Paenisporosarcina indica]|uniref:SMI1/KNR4 family protein n=1 Tax=Paenisporosarcina indica TaxID=650093 RepID=UPI00094F9D48|nr:SMI1/KNR4 family protein [Paenisporosarcina indica]
MRLLFSVLRKILEKESFSHKTYNINESEFRDYLHMTIKRDYISVLKGRIENTYAPTEKGLEFLNSNRRFNREIPNDPKELPQWVRFEGEVYTPKNKKSEPEQNRYEPETIEYFHWSEILHSTLNSIKNKGGIGDLFIDQPASESDVLQIESTIGFKLPESFKKVVIDYSRQCDFYWNTQENSTCVLDDPTIYSTQGEPYTNRNILNGGIFDLGLWNLDNLILLNAIRIDYDYLDEKNEEFHFWSNSFIFSGDGMGNYFGIDRKYNIGEVIYLTNDKDFHGWRLGKSFESFMNNWIQIGCAGGFIKDYIALSSRHIPYINNKTTNSLKIKKWLEIVEEPLP